jgi:hypothetical protein
MVGKRMGRETACIDQEMTAMPQVLSPELALVAIDTTSPRHDGIARERAGAAGPGWFDSSWDLRRGLEVREDCFGDDCLHGWIERFLAAQRTAAGRTASPSASTAIA